MKVNFKLIGAVVTTVVTGIEAITALKSAKDSFSEIKKITADNKGSDEPIEATFEETTTDEVIEEEQTDETTTD